MQQFIENLKRTYKALLCLPYFIHFGPLKYESQAGVCYNFVETEK